MSAKQQMRREVSMLCLIFMLYMVVVGLGNGITTLLDLMGINLNDIGSATSGSNYVDMLAYLGTYTLVFVAPLAIFFIIHKKEKTTDYFYLNRAPKLGITLLGAIGVLAINYTFTVVSEAGEIIFTSLGVGGNINDLLQVSDDPIANVLYFFILVIAPALLEEFCFRGAICGRLARYNRTAAVLFSSVLFSLAHMTVEQIPFALAAGLLMGYVYLRTGSIWSTVIIHAVNNGFAFGSEYLYHCYDGAMSMRRVYMLCWAGIFLIGLVAMVILGFTHKDREEEPMLALAPSLKAGASSPLFIICCAGAVAATVAAVPLV